MSQQPHDMGYLEYAAPTSRSPNSSRQNYAAGFNSGLSLPRQSHRPPFDVPLGSSALYPSDRMNSGYNHRGMDNMPGPGAMHGAYMLDNGQSWNYNTAGAATVNGAVNGPNRQRSVNRRAALPQVRADILLDFHLGVDAPCTDIGACRIGLIKAAWACPTVGSRHSLVASTGGMCPTADFGSTMASLIHRQIFAQPPPMVTSLSPPRSSSKIFPLLFARKLWPLSCLT